MAIELTTTIRIAGVSNGELAAFADRLEDSIDAAIQASGMATITAFFVIPKPNKSAIEVGLRFDGMKPEFVRETATEILKESLSTFQQSPREPQTAGAVVTRLSSQLVGA